MIRLVLALVLAAHGIGHVMGILQELKVATVNPEWDGRSWILSDVAGSGLTAAVGVALWAIAMVGFVVLAGVVMGWLPDDWWAPLGVVAPVVSIASIVLFPNALPTFSTIGALVIDGVVLTSVVWAHWTPADLAA
jgi:hypothetical protein